MRGSSIRHLWPYLRGHWGWLIGCLSYAVVGATASAFSPYVLGRAVDELQRGVRLPVLAWYAVILLVLASTLAIFRFLLRMLTGAMAATVSYKMSQDTFARLLILDRAAYAEFGTGDLLSRATLDFIYVWRFFSAGFQMMLHSLVLLVIGCVLMAFASPPLALLVFGCLMISLAIQLRFGRVLESAFDRVQRNMAVMSSFAQEHLATVRMVKAYRQEEPVVGAFDHVLDDYVQSNMRFALRSGVITPLPGTVVRLTAAAVLGLGGALVIRGGLTVGQLVQFIVYLGLLNNAVLQISQAFERLQQGAAATGRIAEVLHRGPRIADAPDAQTPTLTGRIQMHGVGLKVGNRWLLHDISFDVPAGSTVGIIGPTGAGKSTLLGLIARVQDPQAGTVLIDGVDVRKLALRTLRGALAIVPQETLLFSMSLRDNITLGLSDVPDTAVEAAIRAARLSNDLPQLPQGLMTPVGERGATLSGGQKQRTAIARALVRDPRILLLDDALASVDALTASQIIAGLAATHAEGGRRTTFIVSQHLLAVRHADTILVLDAGTIVEQGNHDQLLALGGRYAALYEREQRRDADEIDEDALHSAGEAPWLATKQ